MAAVKVTLSIPEETLIPFREKVGKRGMSQKVSDLIQQELLKEKWKKFSKLATKNSQKYEELGLAISTEEIISAYKDDRK